MEFRYIFYSFDIICYIEYPFFTPCRGVVLVSVYYYKLFGGYCVAAWRPCNVKLAKVISSVLPQLPYRCEHVEGQREKEKARG